MYHFFAQNSFDESSDNHHFPTRYNHGGDVEYTVEHHGPTIQDSIHYVENNDLEFIRPPR